MPATPGDGVRAAASLPAGGQVKRLPRTATLAPDNPAETPATIAWRWVLNNNIVLDGLTNRIALVARWFQGVVLTTLLSRLVTFGDGDDRRATHYYAKQLQPTLLLVPHPQWPSTTHPES